MQLNVDLNPLLNAVRRMGAPMIDFQPKLKTLVLEPIDIALYEGKEISIEEISYESGLLSYNNRQILLYIQDQGNSIVEALEDGIKGRRYHVADCVTLQKMRDMGKFNKYVVTNRLDGDFFVSGKDWKTKENHEGYTDLKVCKNCLKKLNYKGYEIGGRKREIFEAYSIKEFFSTYSSFFKYHPKYKAGTGAINDYTDDWGTISGEYKAGKDFTCEQCDVDLSDHHGLLHVHHISGVKFENDDSNLRALCADCHRKQSFHGHMFVSHADMKKLNGLRRQQNGLLCSSWEEVFNRADPATHGLLKMCQKTGSSQPEIGFEITGTDKNLVTTIELAWPLIKTAVGISQDDIFAAKAVGWQALTLVDALEQCEEGSLQL